jgi:hypothetical protein
MALRPSRKWRRIPYHIVRAHTTNPLDAYGRVLDQKRRAYNEKTEALR